MIVVADTTPLNYLIQLGYPEVLSAIFGQVVVPPAVLIEMQHPEAPSNVREWAAAPPAPPSWLQQISVQHLDKSLGVELGAGEGEAISVALELHADVLLIDELAGRRQAEARNIAVTGTLAVLLQASLRGHCDFPDALKRLRLYGFWVSKSTEALMMRRYEKAQKRSSPSA